MTENELTQLLELFLGAGIFIILLAIILFIAICIPIIIAEWKLFKKAGKNG